MNRKYIRYLFVIISLFFIGIIPVSAKENCTSVKSEIDKYDTYVKTLETLDCTNNSDSDNVVSCNDYNMRKNLIVTDLMKRNEEKSICSNEKNQVKKIIKENEDKCGQIFDSTFNNFVNKVMLIFYIAGPILLILFGSLDFAKATVSSEADALKKATTRFAKRLAATILLFLAPVLVNIVISFNVSDKYLSGNAYACDYKYLVYTKTYNIKYVPKSNGKTNSSSGGYTITAKGNYIWAVGSTHNVVTSVFGPRLPSAGTIASKNHNGIDFGVDANDNVYAIANGVIVEATYSESMGNYVTLQVEEESGTTMQYIFMHNNKLMVSKGQTVNQGDVIALAGSTGHSYGTHCHLRAYNVDTDLYVNPLLYIYGGIDNISAINESTHQIEKISVNATMSSDSWSSRAGTKWNSYYDCKNYTCSSYNQGKMY